MSCYNLFIASCVILDPVRWLLFLLAPPLVCTHSDIFVGPSNVSYFLVPICFDEKQSV